MARYPVSELGRVGLILDESPDTIPVEAWSGGDNVRFTKNGVERAWGELDYLAVAIPMIPFYMLTSARTELAWSVLSIGISEVYASIANVNYDLTQVATWVATDNEKITGTMMNNLPVFNHPSSPPKFWDGDTGNDIQDLPGLLPTDRFTTLRSFGNFLVALGAIPPSGVNRDPNYLRWSTAADPGSVPPTWDPVAAGSLAGDNVLAETAGTLIDCKALGNVNYIYKNSSVYTMQFVGGNSVFKFDLKFDDFGVLATDCIASFKNYHFVVTTNDFIVHNGVTWESVGNDKVRRFFQEKLNSDFYTDTFVQVNESQQEIWVFFSTKDDDERYPTQILIWNWETGAWGDRDCTPATCGATGYQKPLDLITWTNPPAGGWGAQSTGWNEYFDPAMDAVVLYTDATRIIHACHNVMERQGEQFYSRVQRDAISFETTDRFGRPLADPNSHKLIVELWPTIRLEGGTIDIYLGGQDDYDDEIIWEGPFVFDPAVDRFITPFTQGKYISVRFETDDKYDFLLEKYVLKFQEVGVYV